MKTQTKKKKSIIRWMLTCNFLSILFIGCVLAIMSGILIDMQTSDDYQTIAKTACTHMKSMFDEIDGDFSYDEESGKLYKGKTEITDKTFSTLQAEDSNIHHTIFWGDTRIISDLKDNNGDSVVGTTLNNPSIISAVEKDGIFCDDKVELYGTKYSVCYYPLKNGDKLVGMIFVGVNQSTVTVIIVRNILIACGVALVLTFIIICLIINAIKKKGLSFEDTLSQASDVAEEKKSSVTDLGKQTVENMAQINIAIDQVSQAVTKQASHTEEIMGSMEEFGSSLDVIMNHVNETSAISAESIDSIEELKLQLDQLEKLSSENSEEIQNISKQIEEDSNAVLSIDKIIEVINDIAFQITILSFNASVEAARAGDAGRGFAVVADSIKDLSDKTKESLEEVTTIVQSVNDKMVETTQASDILIEKNNNVIQSLVDTRERLDGVTKSFNKISENITNITDESIAVIDSKNQVIETVAALAAASEENAAMSEEIKATSDEVIDSTHGLLEEIDRLHEITQIIDDVKILFMDM